MSELVTGEPDDEILSRAKETLPDYLIKIREEFILDMKGADELTPMSPGAIAQDNYRIRFQDFWKVEYDLETIMDRLTEEDLEYFAESTFPSLFNMFSTTEYCFLAKEFIRKKHRSDESVLKFQWSLIASMVRHRPEFSSSVRRFFFGSDRTIQGLIEAIKASIGQLSEFHQNLFFGMFKPAKIDPCHLVIERVFKPMVRVWPFENPKEKEDFLSKMSEMTSDSLKSIFKNSYPLARLPRGSGFFNEDIFCLSQRDIEILERIQRMSVISTSQDSGLVKMKVPFPAHESRKRSTKEKGATTFEEWMSDKAIDIRLMKESAKCAREWINLVLEHNVNHH